MTPLVWIILFMLAPLAFPGSVIHFLRRRWPLNVMQANPGESRARGFARILTGSLLFGSVVVCSAGAWQMRSGSCNLTYFQSEPIAK
jgi:hypothetical protein